MTTWTNAQATLDYIDEHFDQHLDHVREIVRQPSVSLQAEKNPDVRVCAELLRSHLDDIGADRNELVEFENGYPLVYGEVRSKVVGAPTMVVYCLYDVMPVDGEDWVVPPFSAEIVDPGVLGVPENHGPLMVSRGAANQKGPLMTVINAVRALKAVEGDIPVNLIFAVEGEEEIGSPHMAEFRDRYIKELSSADAAYLPSPFFDIRGRAQVHFGTKGLSKFDLRIRGGEWGGPAERSLWSADSIWVDAPAWIMVKALASLVDDDLRCRLNAFSEGIRPLTPLEQAHVDLLRREFDEDEMKRLLGIRQFRGGCLGSSWFQEYITGPVFNLDGYQSGYTGASVKTNLPDSAFAKMDVRVVADMDIDEVVRALREHLDSEGFGQISFDQLTTYSWGKVDPESAIIQAALATHEEHKVDIAVWPWTPYCAPMGIFSGPPLNLPFTDTGLGWVGRWHQANEYISVPGIRANEKWVANFLHNFASGARPQRTLESLVDAPAESTSLWPGLL